MSEINNVVVITQSLEQNKDFVKLLNSNQIEIFVFPVVKIVPREITPKIHGMFSNLEKYDWIVFTSPNSVRYFYYVLLNRYLKYPQNGPNIACIGKKTAFTLKTYGKKADLIVNSAEELKKSTNSFILNTVKTKIFIPVEENEEPLLQNSSKISVTNLAIYKEKFNPNIPEQQIKNLTETDNVVITFFTPKTIKSFIKFVPPEQIKNNWLLIAGGEKTAKSMADNGINRYIKVSNPSAEEFIKVILDNLS